MAHAVLGAYDPEREDLERAPRGVAPGKRTRTAALGKPAPRRAAGARGAEPAVDPDAEASLASAASAGGTAAVLAAMSELFEHDFSSVRLRTDSSATALGALAYTVGDEVTFAPGQLDTSSDAGRGLLAHELAHVVQQAHGWVSATTELDEIAVNDDAALERAADDAAARVLRGERAGLGGGGGGGAIAQRKVAQRRVREASPEGAGASTGADAGAAGRERRREAGPTAPGALHRLPIDELVRLSLADPADDLAMGIHPDTWLAELGTSRPAPSAPRSTGRRPRRGRSGAGRSGGRARPAGGAPAAE